MTSGSHSASEQHWWRFWRSHGYTPEVAFPRFIFYFRNYSSTWPPDGYVVTMRSGISLHSPVSSCYRFTQIRPGRQHGLPVGLGVPFSSSSKRHGSLSRSFAGNTQSNETLWYGVSCTLIWILELHQRNSHTKWRLNVTLLTTDDRCALSCTARIYKSLESAGQVAWYIFA